MLRFLVIALLLLTALIAIVRTSALPVVLDLRLAQVVIGLAAVVLAAWRARAARARGPRAIWSLAAIAVLLLPGSAGWDLIKEGPVHDVTFRSGAIELHGFLHLPAGSGPYPAIVLVHGSGPMTRDEFRYYARRYAERGIAALAYDKRGAGASGGDFEASAYADFAADAAAAVRMLRARDDIRGDAVGLWGLSEGEWVAPLAALDVAPAFLVLVSASAMTPADQVGYETGASVRRAGFGEDAARRAADLYARVSAFERTGEGRDALNEALSAASTEPWFDAAENLQPSVPPYERVLALPWFPAWRARMDFDALPVLATLRCPVLAQAGGADPKNDGAAALDRLRDALARGGNRQFTGIVYPDADHGVIEWRLPGRMPPPWFADSYLETQLDWVAARVGLAG